PQAPVRRVVLLTASESKAEGVASRLRADGIDVAVCHSVASVRDAITSGPWDAVFDLRAVDGPGADVLSTLRGPCAAVLDLMRLLVSLDGGTVPRLWLAARELAQVSTQDAPDLSSWPLWGMANTFASEHPAVWGGLVDVGSASLEDAVTTIVDEAFGPENDGP